MVRGPWGGGPAREPGCLPGWGTYRPRSQPCCCLWAMTSCCLSPPSPKPSQDGQAWTQMLLEEGRLRASLSARTPHSASTQSREAQRREGVGEGAGAESRAGAGVGGLAAESAASCTPSPPALAPPR